MNTGTCIVGHREPGGLVWLGSDSLGVDEYNNMQTVVQPKQFRIGMWRVGYTSSFRYGEIIRHHVEHEAEPPFQSDEKDPYEELVVDLIPKIRKELKDRGYTKVDENREDAGHSIWTRLNRSSGESRIFHVQNDFSVLEYSHDTVAVGCGAQYALGAALASPNTGSRRVLDALQAAARFSSGVGAPYHISGPSGFRTYDHRGDQVP